VDDGIEADGSNLSGVSGQCLWEDTSCKTGADSSHQVAPRPRSTDDDKENVRSTSSSSGGGRHHGSTLRKGLATRGPYSILPPVKAEPHDDAGDDQISTLPHSQYVICSPYTPPYFIDRQYFECFFTHIHCGA